MPSIQTFPLDRHHESIRLMTNRAVACISAAGSAAARRREGIGVRRAVTIIFVLLGVVLLLTFATARFLRAGGGGL